MPLNSVRIERNGTVCELHNCDCMDYLRGLPNKAFDLAIVDPPYGKKPMRDDGGTYGIPGIRNFGSKDDHWDVRPDALYFDQLKRVSSHQIIWGMNYFLDFLNPTNSVIVWDKLTGNSVFADCDLAWTSHSSNVKKFTFQWSGMLQGNMSEKEKRIHPTQKPVALYSWLLANYAQPGQTILDTHLGSGSIAIACLNHGYSLTGCELDEDYFKAATERIQREANQGVLL